ncbi:hypothetical protein DL274_12700 [Shigella dysenteriae]|nr:hypothetical protein [Shigella dysenteriae]
MFRFFGGIGFLNHLVWLNVKILLFYCLFLRDAPHHSEAKFLNRTFLVLPLICGGATWLRRG